MYLLYGFAESCNSDHGPYFSVFGPVSRMLFYRAKTLKWFALLTDFQSNFTEKKLNTNYGICIDKPR